MLKRIFKLRATREAKLVTSLTGFMFLLTQKEFPSPMFVVKWCTGIYYNHCDSVKNLAPDTDLVDEVEDNDDQSTQDEHEVEDNEDQTTLE